MSEKKRDAGYRAALTGAKGTVRLLIYVCVILVIILAAKTSYQFGHDVFAEEPVASRGKGKEVTVQVRSGSTKAFWFSKSSTACPATTAASRTVPTC